MIDKDPKVLTMLAGADAQLLFYQMQPAFLADARFSVASIATSWADCEKNFSSAQTALTGGAGGYRPLPGSPALSPCPHAGMERVGARSAAVGAPGSARGI